MPKFSIKIEAEYEIEAVDEQHAEELFFQDTVYDTQSDPATFIADHLTINEIK